MEFNALAEQVLGQFEATDNLEVNDIELDFPRQQSQLNRVDNTYIKEYKSPHTKVGFTPGDFQIGSVVLPVAPSVVRVNRIRDVHTMPVMRGASIPARQGEGVTTIDMTIDIPDYTSPDGSVNALTALIAEFKVSPFTVLRNRDLSSKVSQAVLKDPPQEIADAVANIRNFDQAERTLRKLFEPFFVTTNNIGAVVEADWQRKLKRMLDDTVVNIASDPESFEYTKSEELEGDYSEMLESTEGISANDVLVDAYNIFLRGEVVPDGGVSSEQEFGEDQWEKWKDLFRSPSFAADVRAAMRSLILASRIQKYLNQNASSADQEQRSRPPVFVPVVLTRMVFRTKPGTTRCAVVDLQFELFNFRAYVDRFRWHHYNGEGWTTTEDPSEADILLRWRDKQFLEGNATNQKGYVDMSKITVEELNKKIETEIDQLASGSKIPGYFKYLRGAWNNRRCKTPPSDSKKHHLRLFYPENIPQIHTSTAQSHGGFYKELVLDDGQNDDGVTTQITVVWDLAIARQIDEFTGTVVHQAVGGTNLDVNFEVAIPIHNDTVEGDELQQHEKMIGRVNRMFDTIEQNRRILPSEAFMPTSVFVHNPITQMFGAYVFEAGDMPVVQYEPGCAKVTVRLSEAIPVVGLGNVLPDETEGAITKTQLLDIVTGLAFFMGEYNATAESPRADVERDMQVAITSILKPRKSVPKADMDDPLESLQTALPDSARRVLTFVSRAKTIEDPYFQPWSNLDLDDLLDFWAGYIEYQGGYYPIGQKSGLYNNRNSGVKTMSEGAYKVALLRYLDPRFQQSGRTDMSWSDILDPVSELINVLDENRFSSIAERLEFIRGSFVEDERAPRDRLMKILSQLPEEAIGPAQEFLAREGLFNGDLRAVVARAEQSIDRRLTHEVRTYMLYPDLILPTIRQALGIDPSLEVGDIPTRHLTRFVPTYSEYGVITENEFFQHRPGRLLDDLADPDIWYAREVEDPILQSEMSDTRTYDHSDPGNFTNSLDRSPTTQNGRTGTPFIESPAEKLKNVADMGRMDTQDFLDSVDVEQLAKPNRRRMLFAFPTYTLEFTLDGQKNQRLTQSAALPMSWEAKFLNFLPVNRLNVDLDESRPNIARVEFISRRAALRNESWHWLSPDLEVETDTFTNNPQRIRELLAEDYPTRSDPTLLTKLILSTGSRVSVRMGYGTDINNVELLPTVLAGTIGEISLGEVSQMVIQDIGMQLVNPLEKTIGGTGNYSPNRVWSGKFTMRAFTDIFSGLDTKYMGRSGRGTDVDILRLTDEEIQRVYDIGVQTRNSVEIVRADFAADAMNAIRDYFHSPIAIFLGPLTTAVGRAITGSEVYDTGTSLVYDRTSRFYPELLNIYPCVTGVSDWAISNTDAKGIQGTYWIDMLARLNPGSVWWVHPFGNESRLFFGRPEQFHRKYPLAFEGEKATALMQQVRSKAGQEAQEEGVDIASLARRIAVQEDNVRGVIIKVAGYLGYEPSDVGDTVSAFTTFENLFDRPSLIDELYQQVLIELATHILESRLDSDIEEFTQRTLTLEERLTLSGQEQDFEDLGRGPVPVGPPRQVNTDISHWLTIYYYLRDQRAVGHAFGDPTSQKFSSDFPSTTFGGFAAYLKDIAGYSDQNPDDSNLDLPDTAGQPLARDFLRVIRQMAGCLRRALATEGLTDGVLRLQQISRSISRARHVLGYRRFRQYHHVMSGQTLLTNRMKTSQAKMANAVQVDSYTVGYTVLPHERRVMSLESDIENLNFGLFQWFKGWLGETDRDKILGILIPNALARGMARMYDGIIEIRGDQKIKPHDIVYVIDLHNGIYGPVKVKAVTHSLDPMQGFVTRIVPELHTQSFSSRVLTEHVAQQRIMRRIAGSSLVVGVAAALLGGPVGITAGIALGATAAAVSTYASLSDTIARRNLVNFSAAETLSKAQHREQIEDVMRHMMLDTFVSSNKVTAISPTEAQEEGLITKMSNRANPQLGVSIFPLMRFGSYAPVVAGLKTEGLVPIDDSFTGVLGAAADVVKGTLLDVFDAWKVLDYIGENIEDVQAGWRATMNAIQRKIETRERAEKALRSRGVEIR